jgi:hypothetical protein
MARKSSFIRVLVGIALTALVAVAILGVFTWRSISMETLPEDQAARRFETARAVFSGSSPILTVGTDGRLRPAIPSASRVERPTRFRVLAYRAAERRLATASLPFWFLKMKGPAVAYSLQDTGLDLDRLGVTPADLERYGPALVLDETRPNGDRLLVWTE